MGLTCGINKNCRHIRKEKYVQRTIVERCACIECFPLATRQELFTCLVCGFCYCNATGNVPTHVKGHFLQNAAHCLFICVNETIYCFKCEGYVNLNVLDERGQAVFRKLTEVFKDPSKIRVHRCLSPPTERPSSPATRPALPPPLMLKPGGDTGSAEIRLHRVHALDEDDDDEDSAAPGLPKKSGSLDDIPHHDVEKMVATVAVGTEQDEELEVVEMAAKKVDAKAAETQGKSRANTVTETRKDSGEQKEEAKGEVRPGTSAGGKAKKESKKIQQRKKGPAAKGEKKTEPEEKKAEKKEEQPLAKERASLGPDVLRTTPTEADQSVRQKTSSSFVQPQLQSPNEDAKKGKAVAANKAQTEGKKCETSKGKPLAALSVSLADGSAAKGEGGNEKHAGAKEGAADMAPALGEKRVAESSGKSETAMVVGAKKTATATVKSQGPTAPAKAEAVKEVVTDKKLEKSSEGGNIQRPTQAKEVGIVLSPEAKATTTTAARQVNNKKQDTKRLEKDVSAPKLNEAAGTATIAAAEKGASAQTRAQHKVDSESAGVTKRGEVIPARSAVAGNNSGSADKSNQAQRSANTANKTETGIVAAQKTVIDAEEASPRSSDEREEGKVVSERATEGERNESVAVPKTEAVPATKDDVSHRGEEAKEKTAGSAKVLAGSETEEKSGPPGLGESHLNVSERKQDSAGREEGCEGGARHEEGKDVRKTESGDKVVETESETAVKPQTETDAVPPPQCDTEITLSPAKAVSPTEPNNDIATGKSAAAGEEHVAQAKLSHDTKNRVRVAAEDRERTVKDHQSEDKEVAESQNAEKNGSAAVNGTDTGIAKDSAKATHAEEETTARICGTFGKEGNSAEDISQSAAVPRTGIAPVTGHDDTTTQEKSPVVVKSSCEGPVQQENDSDRGDAHDNPQCETAARPEEQKAHAVDAVCEEDTRKRKAAENSEKRVPEAESRDKNDTRDASTKGKVGSVTDRISEEVEKVSNVTGQQNLERSAPGDGLEIGAGKVLRKTEGHHAEVVAKTAGEENSSSVVQTEDAAVAPKNGSDKRVCEPQNETRKVSGEVDATEEARTANVRKAAANGEAANPCREYTANPHSAEETGTDKRDAVATTIHEESHDQPGEESTVRPVAAEQGATPIVGTMREKSDEVTRIVAETAEPIAPGSNKTAEKNGTHEASGECSSQEKAEAPLHSKSNTLDECQNISATKQNENRGPEMKHDDDDDDTAVLPKNKSSLGSPAGHTNKGGEGPESQVAAAKRETDTVLLSAHPEEASRKARQMADTKGLAEEKNHAKIIIESGPAETAALLANKDVRAGVEVRGKAKDAAEKGTELADLMRSDNVQPARNALRQAVYHDVQSAKSGDDEPDSVTEPQMPKPIPSDVMRSAQPGIVPSRAANANVTAVQESILPAERSVRGSNPFVAPADVPTKVLRSAMPLPVNGNIRNPGVDSEKTGDNPMLQVPTAQDQQDYHASTALAPADQTHLAKTASQFARISPHTEREAGPSHGESDLNISSIEPSAVRNPSPLKRENSLELMIESMMNDLQELGVKNRSRSPVPERKHTPEKRLSAAPIPLRGKRTRRQNPNEFRYSGRNKAPLTRTQLADMSLDFSAKKSQSPSRVKVLTFGVAECGITQKDHDFATHPRQPYPSAGQDAVSGTSPIGMQLEVDSLLPITQERGLRNSRPLSGVSSPAPMRNVVLALSRRAIKKSGQYNIISPFIARSFVGSSAVSGRQSVSRSMRMNSMMSGTYSRATVGYSSGYGQIRKTRGKPEKHIRGLQNHGNTSHVNAILQAMCAMPELVQSYLDGKNAVWTGMDRCNKRVRDFFAGYRKGFGPYDPLPLIMETLADGEGEYNVFRDNDPFETIRHLLDTLLRGQRRVADGKAAGKRLFDANEEGKEKRAQTEPDEVMSSDYDTLLGETCENCGTTEWTLGETQAFSVSSDNITPNSPATGRHKYAKETVDGADFYLPRSVRSHEHTLGTIVCTGITHPPSISEFCSVCNSPTVKTQERYVRSPADLLIVRLVGSYSAHPTHGRTQTVPDEPSIVPSEHLSLEDAIMIDGTVAPQKGVEKEVKEQALVDCVEKMWPEERLLRFCCYRLCAVIPERLGEDYDVFVKHADK